MELLFEIIFELVFEGSAEVAKNKKVSKWIRYPIIVILSLIIIGVIGLLGFLGIVGLLKNDIKQMIAGIVILTIDILLIISMINNIKKALKNIKTK